MQKTGKASGVPAREDIPFLRFSIEYPYAGERWCFDLLATSHEDAELRLRQIAAWGKVCGEILETIPVALPGARWYVRLRCWWWANRRRSK